MSDLPENVRPPAVPTAPAKALTKAPRRGGVRVLVYVVVFAAGAAAAVGFEAIYRADLWTAIQPLGTTASAYLEVNIPERPSGQAYDSGALERRKATYVLLVKRSSVMEEAATSEDVKRTPWYQESPADAPARLTAAIKVSSIPQTNLIAIRMSGAAPDDLVAIVNTVAKVFVESSNAPDRQVRFDQINELKKYAIRIRGELAAVSRERRTLRRTGGPDPRQAMDVLNRQLGVLATRRVELALDHQRATQQLATFLQQEKDGLLDTRLEVLRALHEDLVLQGHVRRQEELRAERDAAPKTSEDLVKILHAKLTAVNKLVEKRQAAVRSLTLKLLKGTLQRKVTDLEAQMAFVARGVAEGRQQSRELEESIAALDAKSTRRQFLAGNLKTVERRRTELTIRGSLTEPIRIAQPAVIPE